MAAIKDVARRAGVSTSTVSHVLNGTKYVSPALRERVLAAVRELGYRPNRIARSLKTRATATLGVVVPNMLTYAFAPILKGIATAVGTGFGLILADSEDRWGREDAHIRAMLDRQVDGLILLPVGGRKGEALQEAAGRHVPVVLVDAEAVGVPVASVLADYAQGSYEAVVACVEAGHRRIAFIAGSLDTYVRRSAFAGYLRGLAEGSLEMDPMLVRTNNASVVGGYKALVQLMHLRRPPDAVLVADHAMTLGAMKAIRELGFRCPGDLCLIGLGDFEWAELTHPPITVVSPPYDALGAAAGDAVVRWIRTRTPPEPARRVLPVRLIRRESTCASCRRVAP